MAEVDLSPPCYTFAKKIKYTYGASKYVVVGDLEKEDTEGNYFLKVKGLTNNVAIALRRILPISQQIGNNYVRVKVVFRDGTEVMLEDLSYTKEIIATSFCLALKSNPLFYGTIITEDYPFKIDADVIITIRKEIIQFYNDDFSDYCRNLNEVAAKIFSDVTNLEMAQDIRISFTTYDSSYNSFKDVYCPKSKYRIFR